MLVPSLFSCLSLVVILTILLFILRNVFVALDPLVHLQSNPLLLFVILFYLIEHQSNPHLTLLTLVMRLRLLQGCCIFLSSLHLSPSLLLGLFLCLCCWTKVYTHVSEKVNLHIHFQIVVRFVFAFLFCWGWPNNNEIGSLLFCKFPFNHSFNCNQCCKCFFKVIFLLFLPFLPSTFSNLFCHLPIHCLSPHNVQIFFWSHTLPRLSYLVQCNSY